MTNRIEHTIFNMAVVVLLIGGPFLLWNYQIDGVFVNRVIKFQDGVDPMNLKMVQHIYTNGQIPQYWTAFCKTREAVGVTRWTLVNEHPHYDSGAERIADIPPGCYPLGDEKQQFADTKPIGEDIPPGEYHYVGVTTHYLPDGRQRKQYYQTEEFQVVK